MARGVSSDPRAELKSTASPPWMGGPQATLVLALAYYVTGRLGLLLAVPPGYATAVWPPSGLALAGILLCGYRVWPAIVVASFASNPIGTFNANEATTIAGQTR